MEVVRHIYAQPIEGYENHPWAYWLTLLKVANKYREPELMRKASMAMVRWGDDLAHDGRHSGDIEGVCAILEGFREIDSDCKVFNYEFDLAKRIEHYTHGSERFRSYLLSRPSILLKLHAEQTYSLWRDR